VPDLPDANSGEGGQNQGRGSSDLVAGSRARGGRKRGAACRLTGSGATEPPGRAQPGGLVPDRWAKGPTGGPGGRIGGPGEAFNHETNKRNTKRQRKF
jgi:hypothetical protein